MKQTGNQTKIVNKTNQVLIITSYGYLYGYKEMLVSEITPQMTNLEKKGLISIRKY